ncbi:hypothetical protein GCM10010991_00370 [Gemmobacter aquaticus]|uniref:Uncharacterized protein n=1 Tax=Gemmobacter aquaticus TaxID=490185 RepID=A0A917YIK1_9RHOB|nr:hypothetical protein GCM10010991_00370 [Gemmobacter aquaticus]
MNWEQIELKWAAMARRVRADCTADRTVPTGGSVQGLQRRDTHAATNTMNMSEMVKGPELETSAK